MQKLMFRHGDVMLVEVDEKAGDKKTKTNMLASGEKTNHGHFVTGKGVEVLEKEKTLFVRTKENEAKIRHLLINEMEHGQEVWTKEHEDITLPPNKTFKVVRQVEFDPYEQKIREVKD